MSQNSVRVGIIGAGGNTRGRHIPNLQQIEGVEVVSVCNRSRESSKRAADEFDIPEHLDVLADMACGAQAHFLVSSIAGLSGPNEVFLFGTKGVLRFSGSVLQGGRRGEDELHEIEIPARFRGGWRVEEEFINAIRGEEAIKLTTFEDGVRYMAFTEAVTDSLRTGTAIALQ